MAQEVTKNEVDNAERLARRMRSEAKARFDERERAFNIIECQVRNDNPVAAVALYQAAAKIMGQNP